MKIVSIEGNIASGKSTLLKYFKYRFKNIVNWEFVQEPVEQFTSFLNYNPLELSYLNSKNIPACQMHITDVLKKHYKDKLKDGDKIYICERSLYSPIIFTQTYFDEGIISNFCCDYLKLQVKNEIEKLKLKPFACSQLFYIDTPLSECLSRIKKRARKEELSTDFDFNKHLLYVKNNYDKLLLDFKEQEGIQNLYISHCLDVNELCKELYHFILINNNE